MRLFLTCATAILVAAALSQTASAQPVYGTYQRTCRNIQVSGGMLSADCADVSGRFRTSSIPYGRCIGDIGNRNGMLNCNGASATGGGPGYSDGPNRNTYGSGPPYGGQPPYQGRDNGGYRPGPDYGRDRASVFPQFQTQESHIRQQIRDGVRDDLIAPDDARDLMGQLAAIQDREQRTYDRRGGYLSADDRRGFQRDLDQLDRLVDRIRREP